MVYDLVWFLVWRILICSTCYTKCLNVRLYELHYLISRWTLKCKFPLIKFRPKQNFLWKKENERLIRCVCHKVPGSNICPKIGNPDFIIFRFSAVPPSSESKSHLKIGNREAQTFQKSRIHPKILGTRMVTSSEFSAWDPQISDYKVQNLVSRYLCSLSDYRLLLCPLNLIISYHPLVPCYVIRASLRIRQCFSNFVRPRPGKFFF